MAIFINYRREDSMAVTGRMDDHLRWEFQSENVYRDVDSIPLGIDFVAHIQTELSRCSVFLAVIGKHWMTERLQDENDFVRMEIEAALARNIPVIPVLVDGGVLPKKDILPPSLHLLLRRNGMSIDSGPSFNAQMGRLIAGIRQLLETRDKSTVPEKTEASPKSEQVIISQPSGVELVRIPGGEFLMGSPENEAGRLDMEGPQHKVHVPDFYLDRYPVTNEEYGRFLEANPYAPKPAYWGHPDFNQPRQPVVTVNWEDARRYCEWAGLRLPSEAEWEYACRAGTTTRFWSGDEESKLAEVGWYKGNSAERPHDVGENKPNPFGLYDVHGNVWEWVEDDWHDNYTGAPSDGSAWVDDPRAGLRFRRGGSWYSTAGYCRSAVRDVSVPGRRELILGFRPARSIP